MAWTYDLTKLATTPLYQVRFAIGDTEADIPLLQDEEILQVLGSRSNNIDLAAIDCCEAIAFKFAKKPDFRLGPETVNYSEVSKRYEALATKLKKKLVGISAPIYTEPHGAIFDIDMMNYASGAHSVEE